MKILLRKLIVFKISIIISAILLLCLPCAKSWGQTSIIELLHLAQESIVSIDVDTAGLTSSKPAAFRDKETGRIFIARKLQAAQYSRQGAGSIISQNGIIVTNAHTVDNASRIMVTLNDQTKFPAKVLKIIEDEDLAFIKIEAGGLNTIDFAKKDRIALRDKVYLIGNSPQIKGSFTSGKITGLGKSAQSKNQGKNYIDLLQIDINLYKGDSGDPLFNKYGELIGIIVATQKFQNRTSYAIPSYKIKSRYLEMLKEMEEKAADNL